MFRVCLMFKPCLKVHWHLRLVELLRLSLCGWWWFFIVLKNRSSSEMNFVSIFAARKRSLRQGNILRSVCHSVHRGRGRGLPPGGLRLGRSTSKGALHPEGSASRGWSASGGRVHPSGASAYRGNWVDPPPQIRKASGTHPTEMLSCLCLWLWFLFTP